MRQRLTQVTVEMMPDPSVAIGQACRMFGRARIEQESRRLHGGATNHNNLCLDLLFRARLRVDVGDGVRQTLAVDQDLAGKGILPQGEIAGSAGFGQHAIGRAEDGRHVASIHAVATIMARRPLIVRLGQDCLAHRNEGDAHRVCGPLHNVFAAAPRDGGQIILSRRQDFQMIVIPANPNDLFDAIVIGCEFLIAQRPVFFDAVQGPLFEISRGVAQSDGVPMHGSAPEDAHSIDRDVIAIDVGDGFGDIPLIEGGLLLTAKSSERQLVGPFVGEQFPRLDLLSCFEHDDFSAALAEFLGHDAAGGAGPDDADVEVFVFAQEASV